MTNNHEHKIYCGKCNKFQPIGIIPATIYDSNDRPWAEIICPECYEILAVITVGKECQYSIVFQEHEHEK